jgi:hypothetical protein
MPELDRAWSIQLKKAIGARYIPGLDRRCPLQCGQRSSYWRRFSAPYLC